MKIQKKYSLKQLKPGSQQIQDVKWSDLEKEMRTFQVNEAVIFAIADSVEEKSLAKQFIIEEMLIKKDNVLYLPGYCLQNNQENVTGPCIILLNAKLEYAAIKAIEFKPNKVFIQCHILQDGSFSMNECGVELADPMFDSMVN